MSQERLLPSLRTERLQIRPPGRTGDAGRVEELAGDRRIADTTLNIPHPYPAGAAEAWFARARAAWEEAREAVWVITTPADGVVGGIGLIFEQAGQVAELGYWVGQPYAGRGLATEAARAVATFGFRERGLRRLAARHFSRNPASGRILEKIGMRREGVFRHQIIKWGRPEDVVLWAMLREDLSR